MDVVAYNSMKYRHGFSLMELLISVSIVSILVAIGIASYATINKQSRDTKRKGDLEQLRSALEMFRADKGYYPSFGGGLFVDASGLSGDLVPTYIALIPPEPVSGQLYLYKATNASGTAYYGYCLNAKLEAENPTDSCTLSTGMNFGVKNP